MPEFTKAVQLLYKQVDVVTNIKRTRDFESTFATRTNHDIPDSANKSREDILIYTGYLKVIDPITKSTILCSIEQDTVINNILILGHNISDIQSSREPAPADKLVLDSSQVQRIIELDAQARASDHPYFRRPNSESNLTREETIQRGEEILDWLKKNRIPAVIDEATREIIIADSARIRPPYEHESDYICPTRIVYKRIKRIIETRSERIS